MTGHLGERCGPDYCTSKNIICNLNIDAHLLPYLELCRSLLNFDSGGVACFCCMGSIFKLECVRLSRGAALNCQLSES